MAGRNAETSLAFLDGGGDIGALMRATDWSKTALGPVENWSQSLRTIVSVLLVSRFPLLLWWGPQYISIYNDAYRPILGKKHPRSIAQPVNECWSDIWHILEPLIDTPFFGGPATWIEDLPLELNRNGFVEETHFTIACSPVPDNTAPRGIGGVLAMMHEITQKIVGKRRLAALRDLGARAGQAKTARGACEIAAEALGEHAEDVPFALVYLIEASGRRARLACAAGTPVGGPFAPIEVALGDDAEPSAYWPLAEMARGSTTVVVEHLSARSAAVPPGPWADPPDTAVVTPLRAAEAQRLAGVLVAGVSSRLSLDHQYRSFLERVGIQIATAIANASTYQEERRRTEALADITTHKNAEAEMRRFNETLEERVAAEIERRLQAEAALRQAQKMEAIGQLTGGVAHDMNNLLLVIQGNLELLERHLPSAKTGVRLRRPVQRALHGVERAAALTQQLLAFARRQPLDPKPIEPGRLVAGMSQLLRRTLGKTIAIETRLADGLWRIFADPNQLENAILNLAVNARDAMPDGGTLTLETVNAILGAEEIGPQAEARSGEYVLIAVRDTGTGMSREDAERAFEPFFTTKGVGKGTGLGLSQVYGFVKQSGGHVDIRSELGRGTTVRIYLPRHARDTDRSAADPTPTPMPGAIDGESTLVVEDDDEVRANHFTGGREI
jgi:signal transduction histidine kinase